MCLQLLEPSSCLSASPEDTKEHYWLGGICRRSETKMKRLAKWLCFCSDSVLKVYQTLHPRQGMENSAVFKHAAFKSRFSRKMVAEVGFGSMWEAGLSCQSLGISLQTKIESHSFHREQIPLCTAVFPSPFYTHRVNKSTGFLSFCVSSIFISAHLCMRRHILVHIKQLYLYICRYYRSTGVDL